MIFRIQKRNQFLKYLLISPKKSIMYTSHIDKYTQQIKEINDKGKEKNELKLKRLEDKKRMLEIMKEKYNKTETPKKNDLLVGKCLGICQKIKNCCKATFVELPKKSIQKIKTSFKNLGKKLGFAEEEEILSAQKGKLKVFNYKFKSTKLINFRFVKKLQLGQ